MADRIKAETGHDVTLVEGGGGIFDVVADGDMVYSKHANGNEFPEEQAVIDALKERH